MSGFGSACTCGVAMMKAGKGLDGSLYSVVNV